MRDRSEDLTPGQLRVLLAVCRLYSRGRPVTVRAVCRAADVPEPSSVHYRLRRLRALGLVSFEDGKAGTIVPRCRVEVVRRGARPPRPPAASGGHR